VRFHKLNTAHVFVVIDELVHVLPADALVTLLGSIKVGGAA